MGEQSGRQNSAGDRPGSAAGGGDRLSLDLATDGSIVLRGRRRRYSLDKLVAQIKPANRHGEAGWGPARGKEAW
jgi:antitoxin component of MazEF toxin-antitoxin module